MSFVAYALLLAGFFAVLYIGIKAAQFGIASLSNSDLPHIQSVAWLGASILPVIIILMHVIGGGIDACLPPDFGFATRVSMFVGALANSYYTAIGLRDKFSQMLYPEPPTLQS